METSSEIELIRTSILVLSQIQISRHSSYAPAGIVVNLKKSRFIYFVSIAKGSHEYVVKVDTNDVLISEVFLWLQGLVFCLGRVKGGLVESSCAALFCLFLV